MSGEVHFKRSKNNPGALINTDHSGLEAYKKRKMSAKAINKIRDEHETMKEDISEIKSLLAAVLRKLDR